MERIDVISAGRPRQHAADPDSITLDVLFSHLPEPVQFTARRDDLELHGRELYSRAVFGEFGAIKVLPAPLPTEGSVRALRDKKLLALDEIVSNPLRWGAMTADEQEAFGAYRQGLLNVPSQPGFPLNVIWPELPQ